jgi:predicted ABC-type ATPase
MATQPLVIVLGGPNGAGKSTAASVVLPAGINFLNADEVAKTLPGYPSPSVDLEAGRIVLTRMDELEFHRQDFAIETTLASRSLAARVGRLRSSGYLFRLIYIWSASAEFSVERVAQRVQAGGHDIPEDVIRRRYRASLRNLVALYLPLADLWDIHDNTGRAGPRLVAEKRRDGGETIHDPTLWESIREGAR